MLNVNMLSVIMPIVLFAECNYAECHFAECPNADVILLNFVQPFLASKLDRKHLSSLQ